METMTFPTIDISVSDVRCQILVVTKVARYPVGQDTAQGTDLLLCIIYLEMCSLFHSPSIPVP